MALDVLSFQSDLSFTWTCQVNLVGSDYNPNTNVGSVRKTTTLNNSVANNQPGGADEFYTAITSIAGAGTATLDLTSLVNILKASTAFARIKAIIIRLLSATDDPTNGTAASSVTIGNAGGNDFVSQSGSGWINTATSKLDLPNGGVYEFRVSNAVGVLVDGTHKLIKLTNNDAVIAAKVQVTLVGGTS